MGWSDCGKNSRTGQRMGYGWPCKCHKRGCKAEIDRGLSYVCGGMHEGGTRGCGYYFCEAHLSHMVHDETGHLVSICEKCYSKLTEEDLKEEEAAWEKPLPRPAAVVY